MSRFVESNAQVLGVSVDSVHCHRAFADSLGGLTFPLLADFHPHGAVTREWGLWRTDRGVGKRAVFIIDTLGIVRWAKVYESGLPDNVEVLSVLSGL